MGRQELELTIAETVTPHPEFYSLETFFPAYGDDTVNAAQIENNSEVYGLICYKHMICTGFHPIQDYDPMILG